MDAAAFVEKWRKSTRTERSASQEFFLDVCKVVGHASPGEFDPTGKTFALEMATTKADGRRGFADAFKRGFFAWENKKPGGDLAAAFNQLLQYSGNLGNPPLLVASDLDRIVVRTHFNGYPSVEHEVSLKNFDTPKSQNLLRKVFHEPEALRPQQTRQDVTERVVTKCFKPIADSFRRRQKDKNLRPEERVDSTAFAHFLAQLVFCMFAEDAGLLPDKSFSKIVDKVHRDSRRINADIADLFRAMAKGGSFWGEEIRRFNGNLFDDRPLVELDALDVAAVKEACSFDWSQMEPSIFGTLFERVMDEDQRAQFGAHYTGYDDIATLIDPVVMTPLRRDWDDVREKVASLVPDTLGPDGGPSLFAEPTEAMTRKAEARALIDGFLGRLRAVRVLDPACGSGNFLYVALRKLRDLEKEVLTECRARELGDFPLEVGPHQFLGIEKNEYAYDLAQMTLWIGHLQWNADNGFPNEQDPILRSLDNFRHMDAILDLSNPDFPAEPKWPDADFIVGNPPFLGAKKLRTELGDKYVESLFCLYAGRLPNFSDLCCYWFEKARSQIEHRHARRAGLLATQGIRGGSNRQVLSRIKTTGDIFFAESDRDWVLDGANVHVSMVGFDDGSEEIRHIDGAIVSRINSDLASGSDTSVSRRLIENKSIGFYADVKSGSFDLPMTEAIALLRLPNPHGRPNSDVVKPWSNGKDVLNRNSHTWIIDFPSLMSYEICALYEFPMKMVEQRVRPERSALKRKRYRELWWQHAEPCDEMRTRIGMNQRYIATTVVSKHRLFVWLDSLVLPDHALFVVARSDDYFFGVLHSRLHEVWALKMGTRLETRPRYTPTTCFETFPFPEPTPAQHKAIGDAAKRLNELRENWLNPPEWVNTEVLEFPGSVDGPWARFVHEPNERGIGTVRYPRLVPKPAHEPELKRRTLTNLYNDRPTWLDQAHRKLDEAVFAAYGWSPSMTDDEILAALLALNLERAAVEGTAGPAEDEPDDADD